MGSLLFAGRAPGYAGLDQFNLRLPDDAEGCSVPLFLTDDLYTATQSVSVGIHLGGGQCVDPPVTSIGILRWKKTVISALKPRTTEELIIEFSAAPGKQPPAPPQKEVARVQEGSSIGPLYLPVLPEGPPCPDIRERPLDAGVLTVQPAGAAPFQVSPQLVNGRLSYVVPLPAGTIHEGKFTVSGGGGADVGPFTTSVDIPPVFEITTGFPPGQRPPGGPLPLAWRGVTQDSVVRVDVKRYAGDRSSGRYDRVFAVMASSRSVQLWDPGDIDAQGRRVGSPLGSGNNDIVVSVSAEGAQEQGFQVAGLTLGGRHGWTYEYVFTDLNTR